MHSVREAWDRIERWLWRNAPKILASLNSGASDEEIAAAEQALGISMPEDWWELYRVHNGLNDEGNQGSLFHGMNFFDLDRVVSEFSQNVVDVQEGESDSPPEMVVAGDPGIQKGDLFNTAWVPLAHDWGASLIRVDMAPAEGGQSGQVIATDSECRVAMLLAPSISEFLSNFADDLEQGRYHLNADAMEEGNEFLNCAAEIDITNWWQSPRWKHLETR